MQTAGSWNLRIFVQGVPANTGLHGGSHFNGFVSVKHKNFDAENAGKVEEFVNVPGTSRTCKG